MPKMSRYNGNQMRKYKDSPKDTNSTLGHCLKRIRLSMFEARMASNGSLFRVQYLIILLGIFFLENRVVLCYNKIDRLLAMKRNK